VTNTRVFFTFPTGKKYDDFMVEEFNTLDTQRGDFNAAKRRLLLAQWASEVYTQLEAEREAAERAQLLDPQNNHGSLLNFYRAFVSTGCMVDTKPGGTNDFMIRPHRSINDDPALLNKLHSNIIKPEDMEDTKHNLDVEDAKKWTFLIGDDGAIVDPEDPDDEPPFDDSCECEGKCACEKEPLPDDFVCECEGDCECSAEWELEVPEDERALIKKAAAAVVDEELRDWNLARRMALQSGYQEPSFVEVAVGEGKRPRKTRVAQNQLVRKSAALQKTKTKKGTRKAAAAVARPKKKPRTQSASAPKRKPAPAKKSKKK